MWTKRLLAAGFGVCLASSSAWAATSFVSPVQSFSCTNQVTTALTQSTGAFTCTSLTASYFATGTQGQVLNSPSSTTYSFTATPVLGNPSVTGGALGLASSSTSGVVTLQNVGATGSYNWNYPTTVGTAGQALVSEGGGSTAMQWATVVAAQFTKLSQTTSSTTVLTSANDWVRFDNSGAGGAVTLTEAASPSVGDNHCALVATAQTLEILANTGETFTMGNITGASAGNLQSNVIGSSVCWYWQSPTAAYVWALNGQWALN